MNNNKISRSRLNRFTSVKLVQYRARPSLQQKLHHSDVELKAHNVTQRSWESAPILNGEQPKAVKDSEAALNDPECVTRAHPPTALSALEGAY